MPILKLSPNKPYTIALKYTSAIEKPGKWGMSFMYTLSDGQILFLPPVAHAEVQALNPGADEPFQILNTLTPGNAAVWSVERVAQPEVIEQPAPKPMAAARSISPAVAPPPSLTTRESIRIFNQLVATIQAAQAAEEFAKSIGREVRFDSQDIRSMAISGFIEQSRRAA